MSNIEVTTKYVTVVPTVPEAFAFVMSVLDLVGEDPSIEIVPRWSLGDGLLREFEVSVEGTDEQEKFDSTDPIPL